MNRRGKLKVQLLLEGDTELNYFKKLKKYRNPDITYKEFPLDGGGYGSFLKEIKKLSDTGYVAKFVILDYDRVLQNTGEWNNFVKIKEYCDMKNKNGRIPYFLIASNYNFEYFACLHSEEYRNGDCKKMITDKFGYRSINDFKKDEKVYEFLNKSGRSVKTAVERARKNHSVVTNTYEKNIKGLNIVIKNKKINIDRSAESYQNTNLYELFDILGC